MLRVLAGLDAVLHVLAPNDPVDALAIEQRTGNEIDVLVAWHAGDSFNLSLFDGEWSIAEIIYRLFGEMQDYLADSDMAWGQARPPCPGHNHPRNLVSEGTGLRWMCPANGLGPRAFPGLIDP